MPESYYLSDDAYDLLCDIAVENGFLRPDSKRKAGISRFLNKLAFCEFEDTRPEEVIALDETALAHWRVPSWRPNIARRIRILDLSQDSVQEYIKLAIRMKIVMPRPFIGGPNWRSFNSIVAATIEAIGCEWLTPVDNEYPEDHNGPKEALQRSRRRAIVV